MNFRSRVLSIAAAILVLFAIGVSQLEAQSTITLQSLSERIDKAFQQIWELERKENTTTSNLDIRVSRLETRIASSSSATRRPTATPTRSRPTATRPRPTPTRVRATDTPVPVVPFITITRPMNLRRGPGTYYPIVRVADEGEKFDMTGRNSQGSWWRIDVEGENAWVFAAYVTATNADRIQPVPTPPRPRPTPQPTTTPRPQTSHSSPGEEIYLFAAAIVVADQENMGRLAEWRRSPDNQRARAVELSAAMLLQISRYCDLSVEDTTHLVWKYGNFLSDAGYIIRTGLPARQLLMLAMTQFAEENPVRTASCEDLFEVGAQTMLESE